MQDRNSDIDEAIRRMYPTGLLDEPKIDTRQLEQVKGIVYEVASRLVDSASLQISHQPRFGGDQYFSFAATLAPAPTPDNWLSFDNHFKHAHIAEHGAPLILWWAHFSFVFPVWVHYFNLWVPRPSDPTYFDANWSESAPTPEWQYTLEIAERVTSNVGFSWISREEQFRPSQGVYYLDFHIDGNDDDDDAEPTLELCNIGQCLFSED